MSDELLMMSMNDKNSTTENGTRRTGNGWAKNILPLPALCIMMCVSATLPEQNGNGVRVSNLVVKAGAPSTVTLDVAWAQPMPVTVWLDSVWVFVDYNDAGAMKRLPLSAGATLTATSAPGVGQVIQYPDNNQGVWVVGNARTAGNFSATVQLLTATAEIGGACAYASNYPPVGEYTSATDITFTGTPEYELQFAGGGSATVPCGLGANCTYTVPDGATLTAFTDRTGAPGMFTGMFSCAKPVITPTATFVRCGSGALALGVTVTGVDAATVNWYADADYTALLQSNSTAYTTPALTEPTTYYIKATSNTNPACSAELALTATVALYEGEIGGEEL
jgi:hypothetical protein